MDFLALSMRVYENVTDCVENFLKYEKNGSFVVEEIKQYFQVKPAGKTITQDV